MTELGCGAPADAAQELGVNALHIKLRATGGNKTKTPGPGAQSALRALARSGIKIGRIGERRRRRQQLHARRALAARGQRQQLATQGQHAQRC